MNAQELREKSTQELEKLRNDLLREQFNLRMQKGTNQLSKPHKIKRVRRDVARINTVLTEKARSST